ncbi:VanZ family protein [Algoriphagus faecimaris]|nr:VanZ family protein [Algoriphagus faecimaris]
MRLAVSVVWLILLAFAMLTPGDRFPEVDAFDYQDKLIHIASFCLLAYLWAGVFKKKSIKQWSPKAWITFLLFGFSPAVAFEYGQLYIPNRSFDEYDLIANLLGAILGILGYFKMPHSISHLH